jgi:hypothetical protein
MDDSIHESTECVVQADADGREIAERFCGNEHDERGEQQRANMQESPSRSM